MMGPGHPILPTCESLDDPGDRDLLIELRNGSETAATRLYQRYAQRLLALAQKQTGIDLSNRFDADDIVQSVFGSFFRKAKNGLYDVPDSGNLWPLLLVIALQKIRAYGAFHRAKCRDVRRELVGQSDAVAQALTRVEAKDSPPFLRLVAEETLEQLPEAHRQLVRWRLQGHDHVEIARLSGRSKRTVERLFQECRLFLDQILGAAADDDADLRDDSGNGTRPPDGRLRKGLATASPGTSG